MSQQANAQSFGYLVVGVSVPGTAEQIVQRFIPDGLEVVITARVGNGDKMYVADSQANAQTTSTRKVLEPGQSTNLRINDTSKIWIDAESASDRLEITIQRLLSSGG